MAKILRGEEWAAETRCVKSRSSRSAMIDVLMLVLSCRFGDIGSTMRQKHTRSDQGLMIMKDLLRKILVFTMD